MALFLLLSSSTAFAQSLKLSSDEIATIKTEINSGKPVRDVLRAHNIGMESIRAALAATHPGKNKPKLTNTQIASIAAKLNLDPIVVQSEIDAGKTFQEILESHNITRDQIRKVFEDEFGKPAVKSAKIAKKHR
ncbi:hypothetical protein EBR96_07040 [bacterium]|nr:hypothetical protein [bacterium]